MTLSFPVGFCSPDRCVRQGITTLNTPDTLRCDLLSFCQAVVEHPTRGAPGLANFIDARTKWLDAAVEAAAEGGVRQAVIVGAGFDTRSYRLCRQNMQVSLGSTRASCL